MHDVVVVGAGPSGSYAAFRCSRYGLDTLLLEKEKLPRTKACGGAASKDIISYLGKEVMEVVEHEGQGNHLFFDYREIGVLERRALFFRRENFDYFITELAENAGCKVMDRERVTSILVENDSCEVRTERRTYSSRIVIGAEHLHEGLPLPGG
ncbi:MAG: FAD-dependent oxidoreductase, partial [Thermoplasmata archaeon]